MWRVWLHTDLLQALKGERSSSVFSPDGTLISASAALHCGSQPAAAAAVAVEVTEVVVVAVVLVVSILPGVIKKSVFALFFPMYFALIK